MKRTRRNSNHEVESPIDRFVFQFAPERETLVVDVIEAVSAVADTDARDFKPRLYDVIDPDALVRCIQSGGAGTSVAFELDQYQVTVHSEGEIVVVRP